MLLLLAALSLGLTDPLPTTQSAWRAVKAAGPPPRLPATDDEWKRVLEPMQYAVLREEATEPPWSSELNKVSEEGAFLCAGCGIPLFTTSAKFESGSGWPSFWAPADAEALALSTDFRAVLPRTETRCARCGGHLGHVFDDGPPPTGRRYCINGAAMEFESGTARADAAARGFDAAEAAPPPLTKARAAPLRPDGPRPPCSLPTRTVHSSLPTAPLPSSGGGRVSPLERARPRASLLLCRHVAGRERRRVGRRGASGVRHVALWRRQARLRRPARRPRLPRAHRAQRARGAPEAAALASRRAATARRGAVTRMIIEAQGHAARERPPRGRREQGVESSFCLRFT